MPAFHNFDNPRQYGTTHHLNNPEQYRVVHDLDNPKQHGVAADNWAGVCVFTAKTRDARRQYIKTGWLCMGLITLTTLTSTGWRWTTGRWGVSSRSFSGGGVPSSLVPTET